MGYTIAITRRRDRWDDTDPGSITLAEWADVVAADPALERIGAPEITPTTVDGATKYLAVRSHPYDGPDWSGMAQFTSNPADDIAEVPDRGGWIYWDRGAIVVKNPSEPMLAKMCEIATRLGARVQGEEGEFYDADNLTT